MSLITTHVLDTAKGKPANGLPVILEFRSSFDWTELAKGTTNADGRVMDLLHKDAKLAKGMYRLIFDTGTYFHAVGAKAFYPAVTVVFEIHDQAHYHIPLLLSPFGYTTYRGS